MAKNRRKSSAVAKREECQPEHGSHWWVPLVGGLIVLAGGAAYFNSFSGPFIFDSRGAISDNPTIRHLWPIGTVFSPPCNGETVSGRPILNLSFALNYAVSRTNVWGYHVTNLVIHLLNGLLLLEILRRTFLLPVLQPKFGSAALPLAGVIVLLWVVHPLQTESVTYIVQRAESLAALFYLLMFYAVIRGLHGRTTLWFGLAVVSCWLGVATKEIVATAPVMVLLYDRTLLAGTFRQAWQRRWGLYLGLIASWGLLVGLIVQRGFVTKAVDFNMPGVWAYARSQPGVILYYLRQVVWPHPLCLDWAWQVAETWSAIYGPALWAVGLLFAATLWAVLRGSDNLIRAGGLLGAWFFLILAPSSSIVPLKQLACEHRMYLPLAAMITLLVASAYLGVRTAGQKWTVRGRLAIGLCPVILAAGVLGYLTFQRNRDYRSDLSIWKDTAMKTPHNPMALNNWGSVLLSTGQVPEAIKHLREALRLKPDYIDAHNNLGIALMEVHQFPEAIQQIQESLRLKPGDAETCNNLGAVLLEANQPAEAIKYFQEALRLIPGHAKAQCNWGSALTTLKQPAEACAHFQEALRLDPNYAEAHYNWGNALFMLHRLPEAVAQYEQALQLKPNYVEAQFNLFHTLAQIGQIREAVQHGLKTARLMPDNPQIYQQIAWLLATQETESGNGAEAVKQAQRACKLTQYKNITCLDTLAAAYAAAGQFDEAVATAKKAEQQARAVGQNSVAEAIHARQQLYHDRKPYRVSHVLPSVRMNQTNHP